MNTIGERLKSLRKEQGMSQKTLGELLGVSQQMITQYETGKRTPKLDTIKNIAKVLDVSVNNLLADGEYEFIENLKEKLNDERYEYLKNSRKPEYYESLLFDSFSKLNTAGKKKSIEQVELLTKIPEYIAPDVKPPQK